MARSDDAKYSIISAALEILRAQKARLCFTSQTLGEFWNASTRPRENRGFGLSTQETDRAARLIERNLTFLPDSNEVHLQWRQLLVDHDVKGVQVHDARLAASMYVHAVPRLLTLNGRDFKRFKGLAVLDPADLAATRH